MRFDIVRIEAVADHEAVGIARFQIARGGLDGQHADQAGLFAERDRKLRIGAAASGEDHGRVLERIGVGRLRQMLTRRPSRLRRAASTLACKARTRRAETMRAATPAGRRRAASTALHDRRSVSSRPAQATTGTIGVRRVMSRVSQFASAVVGGGLRVGEHDRGRVGSGNGGRGIGARRLDHRKGACGRIALRSVRGTVVGDDDNRALQRHAIRQCYWKDDA